MDIRKPSSIEEAIKIDNALEYVSVPPHIYEAIVTDSKEEVSLNGVPIVGKLRSQIAGYKPREEGCPKVIFYEDKPIRAVSALFRRIPLHELYNTAVEILGEPAQTYVTPQAIICRFNPLDDRVEGLEDEGDFELSPVISMSLNFAERSLSLGFVVGVFFCANQLFWFGGQFKNRVVHNVHKMKDFNIKEYLEVFAANYEWAKDVLMASQRTTVTVSEMTVYYWKAGKGRIDHVVGMLKRDHPITLWNVIMNISAVSTHEISNFNTAFGVSTEAGGLLETKLADFEYVAALAWYMEKHDDLTMKGVYPPYLEQSMDVLKLRVRELIEEKVSDESIHSHESE